MKSDTPVKKIKYKSFFEEVIADYLKRNKVTFVYESRRLPFVQPAKKRNYKPDFDIPETGYLIEAKGQFTKGDRDKMLWVREQHPELKIVILFQKPQNPIRKGSKTTYADWCDKNGIEWSGFDHGIPKKWIKTK